MCRLCLRASDHDRRDGWHLNIGEGSWAGTRTGHDGEVVVGNFDRRVGMNWSPEEAR